MGPMNVCAKFNILTVDICQFCYVLSSSLLHQVVLMVGLPASGKSVWARNYMKQHPEKRHRLLGTEELLACMIVSQISGLHSCDSHSEVMVHTWCKMFDLCVCVCIEWWAEGQQAPAGLSLSYWNNQDGCPNSWKLHPRPGNASRSKKKDLWDVPLWNSPKDSSCYQV